MTLYTKISGGLIAAATLTTLALTPANANPDAGLYDPVPPEGSAFVRFINDDESGKSVKAIANDKTYDYVEFKEISPYFVVEEGKIDTSIGDAKSTFTAESGGFYTVILGNEGALNVETDTANDNRAKAQITLYNITGDADLSVKTSDGKVEIIPSTATGKAAERQINPVKVSLAVYKGDTMIKDLGEVSLDRSNSYDVVAFNDEIIAWNQSTTNTTR